MAEQSGSDLSILSTTYYCVEELTLSILGERSVHDAQSLDHLHRKNQYLQTLLGYNPTLSEEPFISISDYLAHPSLDMLRDENAFILTTTWRNADESSTIQKHIAELHTRILGYCYATEPRKLAPALLGVDTDRLSQQWDIEQILLSFRSKSYHGTFRAFSYQYTHILKSWFRTVDDQYITEKELMQSFHPRSYFLRFIKLQHLDKPFLPGQERRQNRYLFYNAASHYVDTVLDPETASFKRSWTIDVIPAAQKLVPVLGGYRQLPQPAFIFFSGSPERQHVRPEVPTPLHRNTLRRGRFRPRTVDVDESEFEDIPVVHEVIQSEWPRLMESPGLASPSIIRTYDGDRAVYRSP
ncbi:hypothetical protein BDZ97DRAFT_1813641 [Flammula alnicola]|nr:hypothetical protein BDZ97DRAFT_1813641 [Flammula alnicola]